MCDAFVCYSSFSLLRLSFAIVAVNVIMQPPPLPTTPNFPPQLTIQQIYEHMRIIKLVLTGNYIMQ